MTHQDRELQKKSLKKIVNLNSKRIVYISCDPSTQARDYKYLIDEGYELVKFSIIDQFPHTYHIETIGLLQKKNIVYLVDNENYT